MSNSGALMDGFVFLAGATISVGLLWLLRPMLQRHALAHPNARSSHSVPTPQGGGFAVVGATISVAGISALLDSGGFGHQSLWLVLAAAVLIAVVGAVDDVHSIAVLPRLFLQAAAVAIVMAALPGELRLAQPLPIWLERTLAGLALLWFVNLVNFMDGIDWMTVAEVVPLTTGLVLLGVMGALPRDAMVVALALGGAMIGFAPFNKPVARLFLGDVGSLSIGLLLGWLLIELAGRGHLAAALLLPLYYLADATVTLLRRFANGEPVMQAHRSHFYQQAMDHGFSVSQIVGRVFLLNMALIALATATLLTASCLWQAIAMIAGGVLVALLLYRFAAKA
jgi:UDP-N-acetylmuramyl pentapeptide phosphotransferase/UDP-N-acetylglucosamine-1-phosphate transferase